MAVKKRDPKEEPPPPKVTYSILGLDMTYPANPRCTNVVHFAVLFGGKKLYEDHAAFLHPTSEAIRESVERSLDRNEVKIGLLIELKGKYASCKAHPRTA